MTLHSEDTEPAPAAENPAGNPIEDAGASWHTAGAGVGSAVQETDDEAPQPVFAELSEFVEEFFAPVFGRDIKHQPKQTWCPEWWRHPEAVYRLDALWRSWEHLRQDPALGASMWLREHLDHHMPYLLDARGPFHGCDAERGHHDRDQAFALVSPYGEVFNPDPGA